MLHAPPAPLSNACFTLMTLGSPSLSWTARCVAEISDTRSRSIERWRRSCRRRRTVERPRPCQSERTNRHRTTRNHRRGRIAFDRVASVPDAPACRSHLPRRNEVRIAANFFVRAAGATPNTCSRRSAREYARPTAPLQQRRRRHAACNARTAEARALARDAVQECAWPPVSYAYRLRGHHGSTALHLLAASANVRRPTGIARCATRHAGSPTIV